MIALVACCGKKLPRPAPAQDLYQSPLFKLSRKWAEQHCERWFILSALHGLTGPLDITKPYNDVLGKGEVGWGADVAAQLRALNLLGSKFVVLAGRFYVEPLRAHFAFDEPLKGLGIGERLRWLKKHTQESRP